MVLELDFEVDQGVSFSRKIFVTDDEGLAVNLSGFSAKMQVRQYVGHPDVITELSTENSRLGINLLDNSVTISLTNTETAALSFNEMSYDLFVINGSSTIKVCFGKIRLRESVTKY